MEDSDPDVQGQKRSHTRSRSRSSLRTSDLSVSSAVAGKPDGSPAPDSDSDTSSDSYSSTSSSEKKNLKKLKLRAVTEEDAYELEHNMIHTERIQRSVTGLLNQKYSWTVGPGIFQCVEFRDNKLGFRCSYCWWKKYQFQNRFGHHKNKLR